jgi:uncharacterized protein (DUF4213/DUF364 family)
VLGLSTAGLEDAIHCKGANEVGVTTRIITHLEGSTREVRVADVRIGLGYTAVMLADKRLGVAYTFREEAKGCCTVFDALRPLVGRPAPAVLHLLESPDPIAAGVGLACANALVNRDEDRFVGGDILDYLDLRSADDVGMVGDFGPLLDKIQKRVRSLTVFERGVHPSGIVRPEAEAAEALPRCQVALITATAIINHTIDGLLQAAGGCREVAVLGASTPLLPEAFAAERVTMLSGVVVKEPQEVLRVVSEGGGMRLFGPHVRKVSVKAFSSLRSTRK